MSKIKIVSNLMANLSESLNRCRMILFNEMNRGVLATRVFEEADRAGTTAGLP